MIRVEGRARARLHWPFAATATAVLITLMAGVVCRLAVSRYPWLGGWPEAWTFPVTRWIGDAAVGLFEVIKPAARIGAWLLAYPMQAAKIVLVATPWPLLIGAATALGWRLGGISMAGLVLGGLGLILASGYWVESMNTLSLVAVSVPLALLGGGLIGIFANEWPRLKISVQMFLDVMQTVPTFAYLTPLLFLFGFGPVVGLVASMIYAAPPMARNVILGLERVDIEIREAAAMSGAARWQQLCLIEFPVAWPQIAIGVNQCLMASLSMVIIAAVIGGFNDIGWEVLLTMRKARFGESLIAGLVIVIFAIIIDRMSMATSKPKRDGEDKRIGYGVVGLVTVLMMGLWGVLPDAGDFTVFDPLAQRLDDDLGRFTATYAAGLDGIKNGAMFYGLLPLRIGLDNAVLPFTWGIQWTATMSAMLFAIAGAVGMVLGWFGFVAAGAGVVIFVGIIEVGIIHLPWPFVLIGVGALGWAAGGVRLALFAVLLLGLILPTGLWERALLSLYLSGAAVLACALMGGLVGLVCAVSPLLWRVVRPICDMLQTIPLFVFLIPVLMFFQIGEFSAFLAICAYAIVPMIRYTRHGLVTTPDELLEAATASGATPWQILYLIRFPYAAPTLLLGLNQTILYAFAMLVIAALIGTTGLGQSIYLALGQADIGLGLASGAAMAFLALIADRLVQGFAEERRRVLGL